MRRAAFIAATAAAALPRTAQAARHPVVVVLNSEGGDDYENLFVSHLTARGVTTVDPSSITRTYHERARLLLAHSRFITYAFYDELRWVETRYHTERAMLAELTFSVSSLPYGGFVVFDVRGTASYRCFDIVGKRIIAAYSIRARARGEDLQDVKDRVAGESLLALAREAGRSLAKAEPTVR